MPHTWALESSQILAPFFAPERATFPEIASWEPGREDQYRARRWRNLSIYLLRRTEPEKPDKLSILAHAMERRTNTKDACERKRQPAAPRSKYSFIRRMLTENLVARTGPMSRFNVESGSTFFGRQPTFNLSQCVNFPVDGATGEKSF
jgi:hypothetical protein